ncbi:hypothetical protein MKX01_027511 [Papaver californicum]|nr:hypothetical protein MKX01_027511 [Papaver californicum]
MLQSMNMFHQTTRPKLLYSSSSCHGRRIRHIPPVLISFPTIMEFNPKFLDCLQHSASKSVLVSSPATMKFCSVLFALPTDNEEFSSDNEEERNQKQEEHGILISSDNGEYVTSAWLKTEGFYEDRSHDRYVGSFKKKHAEQEFNIIKRRCKERTTQPYMCIIAVRKEGDNVHNAMLKNVIGTLDFRVKYLLQGETYPEEVVKVKMFTTFKKRNSQRYVIISNVTVAQSARRMGVGKSMLQFAIESAKGNGIKQVFLHVRRDNQPALALYEKMGFEILAKATRNLEEHNLYLCSLNL